MNLLGAKLYDPAGAVSKATSALLAMTALDTTNLRVAVTVPAHGMVRFRLLCTLEGATTFPQILLGVLNGATVVGRVAPLGAPDGTALATTRCTQEVEFTATGLTPGAANFDAAYGVETVVAATNIKYGGPNNTTADDAFGAFVFEAWDPQPQTTTGQLSVDANGRVDVIKVAGTTQTAGDIPARLPAALVSGRIDASVGAMAANVLTAAAINAAALNGKGDWNIGKTGYSLVAGYDPAKTASQAGDAMALTAAAVDAVLDDVSEGTLTARQMLRIILAATAGKADGLAGTTVHYRDQADTKNRITATVDASGNRTAMAVDGT